MQELNFKTADWNSGSNLNEFFLWWCSLQKHGMCFMLLLLFSFSRYHIVADVTALKRLAEDDFGDDCNGRSFDEVIKEKESSAK